MRPVSPFPCIHAPTKMPISKHSHPLLPHAISRKPPLHLPPQNQTSPRHNTQNSQPQLRQPKRGTTLLISSLSSLLPLAIPSHIHKPAHSPHSTHDRGGLWVYQSGDQQSWHGLYLVLDVVRVGALRAVELEGGGGGIACGCVGEGVGHVCGFAVDACVGCVGDAEDEG